MQDLLWARQIRAANLVKAFRLAKKMFRRMDFLRVRKIRKIKLTMWNTAKVFLQVTATTTALGKKCATALVTD